MKNSLEEEIGVLLRELKLTIALAESATGGAISNLITNVSGSSDYFRGSVVSYDNEIKEGVLGVRRETLEKYGAVSSQTAEEMAQGVRNLMNTDIGLSDTGIAGPGGATPEKPVGLFYIGLSSENGTQVEKRLFHGDRIENKRAATTATLRLLKEYLSKKIGVNLEEKHVVTCFMGHGEKILLLKRSQFVGSYRGRWAGVSGYVEEGNTAYQQALEEIKEETGLDEGDIELAKEGKPLEIVDQKMDRKWIVHPYRFLVMRADKVEIDWEHTEIRWIDPEDMGEYETVPQLKEAWEEVSDGWVGDSTT